MSVQNFLKRTYTQDAVYWGPVTEDGYGAKVYATPIQIKCRWEERDQTLTNPKGAIIGSRARVFVLQDVEEEGFLFQGKLADLSNEHKANPMGLDKAWSIKQFEKVPELGSPTNFIRIAYLLIWQRR